MGRGVDRKKLAAWQRRLSRYEQTGLTAIEFCKRERVSVALLKYWRRQVELAALRSPAPEHPRPQAAVFEPVEVIPRRWIVVRFPGGATLEIPDDRVDLVRLVIDRMAAQQEIAAC
jgi:transposase-like protein